MEQTNTENTNVENTEPIRTIYMLYDVKDPSRQFITYCKGTREDIPDSIKRKINQRVNYPKQVQDLLNGEFHIVIGETAPMSLKFIKEYVKQCIEAGMGTLNGKHTEISKDNKKIVIYQCSECKKVALVYTMQPAQLKNIYATSIRKKRYTPKWLSHFETCPGNLIFDKSHVYDGDESTLEELRFGIRDRRLN